MIEVRIVDKKTNQELALIELTEESSTIDTADFSVRFGVSRGGRAMGFHQRAVWGFPFRRYNYLALLKIALDTLSEEDLKRESGPSDMARPKRGARKALPREAEDSVDYH